MKAYSRILLQHERRKRKISISQNFITFFVCFLVHYKDRLQAFGCRTEERNEKEDCYVFLYFI